MKFYDVQLDGFDGLECNENNADGMWATRDDAEQAAKDAVRAAKMALLLLKYVENSRDKWSAELKAIIKRYGGGTGNG